MITRLLLNLMAVEIKQVLEKKYDKVMTTKEMRELKVKQIKQMSEERKRKGGGKWISVLFLTK